MEIFKWRHHYSQISGLHAVVVCLLLGAVVLVVGLVQLAPGATTTDHRLALLVAGSILLLLGEPFFPFSYFVKLYQENAELMPERLVPSWRMGKENGSRKYTILCFCLISNKIGKEEWIVKRISWEVQFNNLRRIDNDICDMYGCYIEFTHWCVLKEF